MMPTLPTFQVGHPFDPLEAQKAKVYPVDWVNEQNGLSDGPKRVYCYLYGIAVKSDRGKNSWPGYVYPSVEEIAKRLGKSEPCVRRDLSELKKRGLLKIERPNQRDYNRYYFLWQADYDRSDVSAHKDADERRDMGGHMDEPTPGDRSDVSAHKDADGSYDRSNPTNLTAHILTRDRSHVSALYKEDSQVIPENYSREQQDKTHEQHHQPARDTTPEEVDDVDGCEAEAYVAAVRKALVARTCWRHRKLSHSDRQLCRRWHSEGVPLATVEGAIITACIRKLKSAANQDQLRAGGDRINSLAYVEPILAEEISQSQIDHYAYKLARWESKVAAFRGSTPGLRKVAG